MKQRLTSKEFNALTQTEKLERKHQQINAIGRRQYAKRRAWMELNPDHPDTIKFKQQARKRYLTWRKKNPLAHITRYAKIMANNPNYNREQRPKNKDRCNERRMRRYYLFEKNQIQNDPAAKMLMLLRSRLSWCIRRAKTKPVVKIKRVSKTLTMLGCSIESFMLYIESKFEPGMNWGNHGRYGWHLDHIMPLAIFDMTNEEHVKRAWHFSNFQPLWAADNLSKSSKIPTINPTPETQLPITIGSAIEGPNSNVSS